jgi:hypothetical protein
MLNASSDLFTWLQFARNKLSNTIYKRKMAVRKTATDFSYHARIQKHQ